MANGKQNCNPRTGYPTAPLDAIGSWYPPADVPLFVTTEAVSGAVFRSLFPATCGLLITTAPLTTSARKRTS